MTAKNVVQVACYLTPKQHEALRQLSDLNNISMQIYLRHAVDRLLQENATQPETAKGEMLGVKPAPMVPDPKFALIYKTLGAAQAFQKHNAPDKVVVRIGRKFGLVPPETAKKMKLKRVQA